MKRQSSCLRLWGCWEGRSEEGRRRGEEIGLMGKEGGRRGGVEKEGRRVW